MTTAPQIFYNLVTRNALLLWRDHAVVLDGPFNSREDAEAEAKQTVVRLSETAFDERPSTQPYES